MKSIELNMKTGILPINKIINKLFSVTPFIAIAQIHFAGSKSARN
jgi:hypothetical protein